MSLEESRVFIVESLRGIFPNLKKYFSPVPGSNDFLEWAKDHYTLSLATNPVWPKEIVELRLQWAGVDPKIFNLITNATNMSACKPEKEYYEEILKLKKYPPENCLLIGDKTTMDLPATEAGIPVFIVGNYSTLKKLHYKKNKTEAWQGSYKHLKKILAASF
jgi:FMN phosphatase YigB (HAD superfamily)